MLFSQEKDSKALYQLLYTEINYLKATTPGVSWEFFKETRKIISISNLNPSFDLELYCCGTENRAISPTAIF